MSIKEREEELFKALAGLNSDQFYDRVMDLGKSLPPFPQNLKTQENRVIGCQSILYCAVTLDSGVIRIFIESDALISKGLGAIAYKIFNLLSLDSALKEKITLFQKLDLFASLSLTRLNGLDSLIKHILLKLIQNKF
jgi:cysteine desulfuration protein SufE